MLGAIGVGWVAKSVMYLWCWSVPERLCLTLLEGCLSLILMSLCSFFERRIKDFMIESDLFSFSVENESG